MIEHFPQTIKSLLGVQNNDHETLLNLIAKHNHELLNILIEKFPEEVKSLLGMKTKYSGGTVLHIAAANNKESLKVLIEKFPKQVESLLIEKSGASKTVLDAAKKNPGANQIIWDFLYSKSKKEEKLLEAKDHVSEIDRKFYFDALKDASSLKILISKLSDKQVQELLSMTYGEQNTSWHITARHNADSLLFLAEKFLAGKSADEVRKILELKNRSGDTVLHLVIQYNEASLIPLIENF
ncbi:ankyrin repeat domain-containing protein [Candidatus Lariskella endosymbiont of Hedychridium roseum]|uniref:ankyrin repeat domain-containing protein n=1 Tax=Candidatus Lariskella endosymbiont of Hedychridium roseum TaxID=3077949 RepID=UPI0030D174C6